MTGYNFYGINPSRVKDNVALLTFMPASGCSLYSLYLMFGIMMVCEGLGLGMVKGAKQEVSRSQLGRF